MVISLERSADLHMAQIMPLPFTVSCFSKIQIGFSFLVPAHLGSPGKRAVKRVCVCVCNVEYNACVWQESDQENEEKDSLPSGRTGLRSTITSPAKSKGPTKKTVGRKKPALHKKASVTLTQMVGSSDTKHLQTVADAGNVGIFCLVFIIVPLLFLRNEIGT